jgi:hypothetical protein
MQQTRRSSEATEAAGPEVANQPTPGSQSLDTILQQFKEQLAKQQAAASSADMFAKSLQIESSVRPIGGVDTSLAACVGLTLTRPRTATPGGRGRQPGQHLGSGHRARAGPRSPAVHTS